MVSSAKDMLLDTLQDLGEEDLGLLQWSLINGTAGFTRIPKAQLEKAGRLKTVDVMVQTYGDSKAVEIMLTTLRKINQKQLAEELNAKLPEKSGEDITDQQMSLR